VSAELIAAIALALAFAFTNGIHDAANAIAALVATRAAQPLPAVLLASVFNVLGPILLGAAVANTIASIVSVPETSVIPVIGAALTGAVVWNVFTWLRGLPSSSGHALVGGLVGAALADSGLDAVYWGGLDGLHPVGVFGALIALALAPPLGALAAFAVIRLLRLGLRRAARGVRKPIRAGEWMMSAWLAFSHGSNDAQKTVGVIALLLFAGGELSSLEAPVWVEAACGVALTIGTALGGWAIVRTIGRRIYRLRPVDGLASQTSSAAVILAASILGAPVSTTQVVTSSVVGVGGGRRRWHRIHWPVVQGVAVAWVATMPIAAGLAALALVVWRWLVVEA
jgi:PiT family inorganic phosphate transporter